MESFTIFGIIALVLFVVFIKGVIKTFRRQAVVAILCLIFLFPIFILWAIVEMFTGEINK